MSRRKKSVTQSKNFQWVPDLDADEIQDDISGSSTPRHVLTTNERKKIRAQIASPERSTRLKEREFRTELRAHLQDEGVNPQRKIWNFKAGDVVALNRAFTHYDYSTVSKYTIIPEGTIVLILGSSDPHLSSGAMSCMWDGKLFDIWPSYFKIPGDLVEDE